MSRAAQEEWSFQVITGSLGLSLMAWAAHAEGVPQPVAHWAFDAVHERAVTDAVGRLIGHLKGTPRRGRAGVEIRRWSFSGSADRILAKM